MAPSATPEAATVDDILNPGEPAELILDDGSRFEGWSFGAATSAAGEAVFQTGTAGARLPTLGGGGGFRRSWN